MLFSSSRKTGALPVVALLLLCYQVLAVDEHPVSPHVCCNAQISSKPNEDFVTNFVMIVYRGNSKTERSFLQMMGICVSSILNSQKGNFFVHVVFPSDETEFWSQQLPAHRNVISVKMDPITYSDKVSWVARHTRRQAVLLHSTFFGMRNVLLMEPDQIYWEDISDVFGLATFDVGLTHTKFRANRKNGCLNYGVVFIREVTSKVLALWDRYNKETDAIYRATGCPNGGENQVALCRLTGGPAKSGLLREYQGLTYFSVSRRYNSLFPTSCRRTDNLYSVGTPAVSHCKGRLKVLLADRKCQQQYASSARCECS